MKTLFFAGLVVVTLVIGTLVATARPTERTYADLERERIALEREQALAPIWTAAQALLILGTPLMLLAVGGAAAWRFFRKPATIRPDSAGRLPVLLGDASTYQHAAIAALADFHATQRTTAATPLPPHTFSPHVTHNPHYSGAYDRSDRQQPVTFSADESGLIDIPTPAPIVPTFTQLLSRGLIGPGRPLLFGYADGQPITGTLDSLYSCGIGGGQGSGKTSIALYLGAMTALQGGELVVIDPHGDSPSGLGQRIQPLGPAISGPVAVEPRQVIDRLSYVWNVFKDRQKRGAENEHPVLLLVDEWTALLRRDMAQKLPSFLADLAIEGRKYGVYAVLCSHRWSVDSTGGADVRNMLTAHFVARNRSEEVRMQTGFKSSALPADPLLLEPGQTIFVPNAGAPVALTIPYISQADITQVGATLPLRSPSGMHTHASKPTEAGGMRGGMVWASTSADAPTDVQNAEVCTGIPHSDAIPMAVCDTVRDQGIPMDTDTDAGAGGLTPDAMRTLHQAGWSKTKIAELLKGAKQKRLAIVEAALQEA